MPAYFQRLVSEFLATSNAAIVGDLTRGAAEDHHQLQPEQTFAWEIEIDGLKSALSVLSRSVSDTGTWGVALEFVIPGRSKRLDAVLLTPSGLIVMEFKVGATRFTGGDQWQLEEYCWNLRDFHAGSYGLKIAPVLVATAAEARKKITELQTRDRQGLTFEIQCTHLDGLADALATAYRCLPAEKKSSVNLEAWGNAPFQPTVDIIDAAKWLYEKHDVREISHSYSDNIAATTERLVDLVSEAKAKNRKMICFVTGVPGAGKTLVGLNTAYSEHLSGSAAQTACFMSGNNPLLKVLRAALAENLKSTGKSKREIAYEVSALLRNIHEFTLAHLKSSTPPSQQIIIFDEAQRSWNAAQVKKKNKKKRGFPSEYLEKSEPEIVLQVMERCPQWCVIIALIGGGQEIHDGEAGIAEWGRALMNTREPWVIVVPPQVLQNDSSLAGQRLFTKEMPKASHIQEDVSLHLAVGKRSYRAQNFTEWVDHVLGLRPEDATRLAAAFHREFPLFITRDLSTARRLLREFCGEDHRCGLLASSGALRLRVDGVELSPSFRGGYSYEHWFLSGGGDIRSSSQLEVAATEFECQGLELDWVGVCWGGDFTVDGTGVWQFRNLKGTKWQAVRATTKKEFMVNKYRVLLTRARSGLVVFVPKGDVTDSTNAPSCLDITANYLTTCGALPM
jgi:hypothetical protein